MASVRALVPRAGFTLHSKQLQHRFLLPSLRYASSAPPPKPRVLEKPDKFRPPSHPSRLRSKSRYSYGPDLTPQQQTRRYPHMMPPEGTLMHWFLTNRSIHVWISLSILVSLVVGIWLSDFLRNTPYLDLLPPNSMFFAHPFRFLGRWMEVYSMHVAYISAQTAERRKQKVEDVKKRSEYRKAHGLDQDEGIFGGWTAKPDTDATGPALREGDMALSRPSSENAVEAVTGSAQDIDGQSGHSEDTYIDFEGKKQPVKKKWFGIW
ncbi:hypothetical protein CBER1_00670 [Lecanosticta acicola]|uniref:Uncharacterized protein n=1 Tax=Lecanosticta acicola TaxID=111012 RepID=A0AAI8Z355_9PEZI|nr:hypothetical protein CBER1_00670 [Lecanosticta acicola]